MQDSYSAQSIQILKGHGARPQTAEHVHRLHRTRRAAPPGVRGRRQLHRRGPGRILLGHLGDHREAEHRPRRGQRPRHPGGHPPPGKGQRPGSGDDQAARRRQVRQDQLQGLRRAARGRGLGDQRPVGVVRGLGPPRQEVLLPALQAGRAGKQGRGGRDQHRHGHHHPLQGGQADLRGHQLQLRHPVQPPARAGLPEQGRGDHASRTSGPPSPRPTSSSSRAASRASSST